MRDERERERERGRREAGSPNFASEAPRDTREEEKEGTGR